MSQNIILVTTDFTQQADSARKHAMILKDKINGKIVLLHILSLDGDLENAYNKMQEVIEYTEKNYGIRISELIRRGNIFEDISKVASEVGAKFVIMGTHGVSGLQHVFGSKALKVISKSRVPFISVTDSPSKNGFNKIVIPFNLDKDPILLLRLASNMAKLFDSEIHVIGYSNEKGGDNKFLDVITNFLESNKLRYIIKANNNLMHFDEEVLQYAKSVDADLISISNIQENVFNMFGGFEQNVIANKQGIPVMVINNNSFGIKQ